MCRISIFTFTVTEEEPETKITFLSEDPGLQYVSDDSDHTCILISTINSFVCRIFKWLVNVLDSRVANNTDLLLINCVCVICAAYPPVFVSSNSSPPLLLKSINKKI